MTPPEFQHPIERLLWVMARLRDPEGGCPWDLEQSFKTIVPYTIEEAYEVADAIDRGNMTDLKEELGDLLLQSVYHAQMASESGDFDFHDVVEGISDKMISRHPHVFGEGKADTPEEVNKIWDARKQVEKGGKSALDGITKGLPALLKSQKLQKGAAKVGYVWPDKAAAFEKMEEEISEFKEALESGDKAHMEEEFGDLLFCLVNYGRMAGIKSEEALRKANVKFEKRFRGMEADLEKDGHRDLEKVPLETWLTYWKRQKEK